MDKNIRLKMLVDIGMTGALLASMSYLLIGEEAHEWIGTALLFLFIFHHILNYKWYRNLFSGTYTAVRMLQTVINLLMIGMIAGLAVSSVILSRYVFDFLPISGMTSFGRKLHMICAYWGFVLMAAHLGLHWGMILSMLKKIGIGTAKKKRMTFLVSLAGFGIAVYGGIAFIRYDLPSYMFLEKQFVFFDVNQPLCLFLLDYIAMMGCFIWLFHTIKQMLVKIRQKRKR